MPKWLWGLLIILLIVIFIIPDPAGSGSFVGNAIESIIIFFRRIGTEITT